jgi:hypothetical protein
MDCNAQVAAVELQMMQSPHCAADLKLFMEADVRKLLEYFSLAGQMYASPAYKLYVKNIC